MDYPNSASMRAPVDGKFYIDDQNWAGTATGNHSQPEQTKYHVAWEWSVLPSCVTNNSRKSFHDKKQGSHWMDVNGTRGSACMWCKQILYGSENSVHWNAAQFQTTHGRSVGSQLKTCLKALNSGESAWHHFRTNNHQAIGQQQPTTNNRLAS